MPSVRYWGLLVRSSVAGGNIAIGELEFRASVGGAALSGTPIFSVQQSGFPASNAFDGNSGTAWASANQIPARVGLDLGSPTQVVEFVLTAWTNFSFGNLTPKDFELQYSPNNVDWYTEGRQASLWKFTEPTWTAGQARTYSYPPPATEQVYKIGDSALMGANDRLALAKIGDSALTGANNRLAVGKVAESVLSGAQPWMSVAKIAVSVLVKPIPRAINGPVQII